MATIIERTEDEECQYCHKIAELRPYGFGGAKICFECAMKPENKKQTEKAFDRRLSGLPPEKSN